MFTTRSSKQSNDLANQALKSTRRVANEALESLAGAVQDLQQVEPLLNRARDQVSALARRGVDSVHDASQQLRDRAQHASDETVNYIKDEPIKAILIAAATGAALMALISYSRSRS
jgi:ElaB/YqjD/DUF883 family membrane-anchored ribosome-binding protein